MKTPRFLLPLLLLSTGVSFTATAYAAPPPVFVVSDKTASDRADELVKRALVLGDKDRYAEAAPLVREAWSLKRSYDIAANLGIMEAALNEWRNAAEHITFALKTFPANGKPEHRKLLEDTLASALPRIAALAIKVNVDRAEVFVDGKSVGLAPLADVVFLEPGTRKIEARLSGYDTATQTVEAAKGGSSETVLTLRESAPVPPPLTPEGGPKTGLLVAGGVTAGAALVAGIVFTAVSNGKASDADTKLGDLHTAGGARPCASGKLATDCAALASLNRSSDTFHNLAIVGYAAAGAVGIATLTYALLPTKKEAPRVGATVAPLLGGGVGGIIVSGRF